jgi:NO-binding membrane sensor protein with MHYT domain
VAEVHHFTYGWINPAMAYVLSFLGSLLGLILTARARQSDGPGRLPWLALAAVSIGGTAIWLMHFMAMLGFDVPGTVVRYDIPITVGSLVIAVVIVSLGLFIVGLGRPNVFKLLAGGLITGLGVAAMHYAGMAAMQMGGRLSYDNRTVEISVVIAVVAATVALWFAVVIRGATASIAAALLMGAAVCSMHYIGMSAIRVQLNTAPMPVHGVSPFSLLLPIAVLACLVITGLMYSTLGYSMNQDGVRQSADLDAAREAALAEQDRRFDALAERAKLEQTLPMQAVKGVPWKSLPEPAPNARRRSLPEPAATARDAVSS